MNWLISCGETLMLLLFYALGKVKESKERGEKKRKPDEKEQKYKKREKQEQPN